jgi:hypothetical protein
MTGNTPLKILNVGIEMESLYLLQLNGMLRIPVVARGTNRLSRRRSTYGKEYDAYYKAHLVHIVPVMFGVNSNTYLIPSAVSRSKSADQGRAIWSTGNALAVR